MEMIMRKGIALLNARFKAVFLIQFVNPKFSYLFRNS